MKTEKPIVSWVFNEIPHRCPGCDVWTDEYPCPFCGNPMDVRAAPYEGPTLRF